MLQDDNAGPPLDSQSLARRLNLRLDTAVTEDGSQHRYPDVRDAMQAAGTPLSRARWHYMRSGNGPVVKDASLLSNLARYFDVDEQYLLREDAELPDRIDAQLDLLKSMREAKVRNFAARQLSDISPQALREIRNMIDEHLEHDASR
ncbi:hypothetical protein [Arthrobacter sp. H14]|uniref:hypothetical protein n=1 Tax=Arthrobacter sp. H14 TaxID=1312959 RepID=UPI000479587B|nr:hypothetical protein [Arthrobacter sp. H14]